MKAKILRRPVAVLQPRALDVIIDPHRIKDTPVLPKCEAKRSARYCGSYEDAHPDKTCTRSARYEIDGATVLPAGTFNPAYQPSAVAWARANYGPLHVQTGGDADDHSNW